MILALYIAIAQVKQREAEANDLHAYRALVLQEIHLWQEVRALQ